MASTVGGGGARVIQVEEHYNTAHTYLSANTLVNYLRGKEKAQEWFDLFRNLRLNAILGYGYVVNGFAMLMSLVRVLPSSIPASLLGVAFTIFSLLSILMFINFPMLKVLVREPEFWYAAINYVLFIINYLLSSAESTILNRIWFVSGLLVSFCYTVLSDSLHVTQRANRTPSLLFSSFWLIAAMAYLRFKDPQDTHAYRTISLYYDAEYDYEYNTLDFGIERALVLCMISLKCTAVSYLYPDAFITVRARLDCVRKSEHELQELQQRRGKLQSFAAAHHQQDQIRVCFRDQEGLERAVRLDLVLGGVPYDTLLSVIKRQTKDHRPPGLSPEATFLCLNGDRLLQRDERHVRLSPKDLVVVMDRAAAEEFEQQAQSFVWIVQVDQTFQKEYLYDSSETVLSVVGGPRLYSTYVEFNKRLYLGAAFTLGFIMSTVLVVLAFLDVIRLPDQLSSFLVLVCCLALVNTVATMNFKVSVELLQHAEVWYTTFTYASIIYGLLAGSQFGVAANTLIALIFVVSSVFIAFMDALHSGVRRHRKLTMTCGLLTMGVLGLGLRLHLTADFFRETVLFEGSNGAFKVTATRFVLERMAVLGLIVSKSVVHSFMHPDSFVVLAARVNCRKITVAKYRAESLYRQDAELAEFCHKPVKRLFSSFTLRAPSVRNLFSKNSAVAPLES